MTFRACATCRWRVWAPDVKLHYCHGGPPTATLSGSAFPIVAPEKPSFWCSLYRRSWWRTLKRWMGRPDG
jgi:hypothetical protein